MSEILCALFGVKTVTRRMGNKQVIIPSDNSGQNEEFTLVITNLTILKPNENKEG